VDNFRELADDEVFGEGERESDKRRQRHDVTCLPQNISSLVVYYNKDLFRRYKVPPPTERMTWAEFSNRAQPGADLHR